MKLIKMSYKGFSFNANPSSIKAEFSKNIAAKTILFKTSKTQEICFAPVKISGSGSFTGENARQYAHSLMRIFKSKGSSYLFAPDIPPIKAFFNSLDISYNADKDCVSYTFEFIEDCQDKKDSFDFGYTYAFEGENLYDISNRTGVSVENIFAFNNYKDLFSVSKGDKVWLC